MPAAKACAPAPVQLRRITLVGNKNVALYVGAGANSEVDSCNIIYNTEGGFGGGSLMDLAPILCLEGSQLLLTRTTFASNKLKAALWFIGDSLMVDVCVFEQNVGGVAAEFVPSAATTTSRDASINQSINYTLFPTR